MFFTRLAIAALSFGSAAKVFAAPIAVEVAVSPVAAVGVALPGSVRGLDLNFLALLDTATTTISGVKGEIDTILQTPADVVDSELALAVTKVTAAVQDITGPLNVPGVDVESLLTDATGNKISADAAAEKIDEVINTVGAIVTVIKANSSVGSLQAPLGDLKAAINEFDLALNVLSAVKALVAPALQKLLSLVGEVLELVTDLLSGKLGLLAGIPRV